ncbi:VOC family protein [Novosphingobium sp. G106]|uniref:VOC family protein n=1 Tax=Novosphingobium sp. G106 TaxID=2849500 RepID=UPI001C2CF13E|nr:VOC family protein [Novosphingobium sp. G106]MBV1688957.1 VOC family protein [Novosphingobium sp. G106]
MSINFGPIRQVGHVVRDADAAMNYWTGVMGVGPFFVLREYEFLDFRYRGRLSLPPVVTLCFAFSGDLQIELIQQHNDAPSSYREFLSSGREGMQHVSPWFDDLAAYDAARARALALGMAMVQESASGIARFCYFETGRPDAPLLELAEALLPAARGVHDLAYAASQGWDGSEPVRTIG